MTQLRYFTATAVEELRLSIGVQLDWYFDPQGNPPEIAATGIRESRLPAPDLGDLDIGSTQPSRSDAANALLVYGALADLTLYQASDERLWAYLCHRIAARYVSARWLTKRPEEDLAAVRLVRNHFFAVGNRALIRDNGLSRLWWLGKIANDVAPDAPGEVLAILLYWQHVQSDLIGRPSVSINRRVLRGMYVEMQRHWSNGGKLFERETFRSWMRALNRRGGVILLDALPDKTLFDLVHEEAERSLSQHA